MVITNSIECSLNMIEDILKEKNINYETFFGSNFSDDLKED